MTNRTKPLYETRETRQLLELEDNLRQEQHNQTIETIKKLVEELKIDWRLQK